MSLSHDALGVLKRYHPTPLRLREIRQRLAVVGGHPKSLGVALQRLQKSGNVKRTGRLWQYVSDPAPQDDASRLDVGIAPFVDVLASNGIETFESCQGGKGHAFPEPTIRFHGNPAAGQRALAVCMDYGLPVLALRRVWYMEDGEPTGPKWELVFRQPAVQQ